MPVMLHTFREHTLIVTGEERDLLNLAEAIRGSDQNEGTLADLAYQIEYEFDVDGIRTVDVDY